MQIFNKLFHLIFKKSFWLLWIRKYRDRDIEHSELCNMIQPVWWWLLTKDCRDVMASNGRTSKAIYNCYLQIEITNCIWECATHDKIWKYVATTLTVKQQREITELLGSSTVGNASIVLGLVDSDNSRRTSGRYWLTLWAAVKEVYCAKSVDLWTVNYWCSSYLKKVFITRY